MSQIHATSLVENGAVIGKNVEIGPFCHVGANVSIGDGCILKSHVVIDGWTTLGEKNTIYPFTSIGGEPQDLKYQNEKTLVTIGSENIIREGVTIHRGTKGGGGETNLGDHNLLMGYVHIAHDCHIGNHNILSNYTGLSGHCTLDDHIIVGLKRKGFSREAISEILEAHRLYFRADLKSDEALRIIEETYGDRKEIREFLDFMVKTDGTA